MPSPATTAAVVYVVVVAVGRDHDERLAAVAQGRQASGGVHPQTTTAVTVVAAAFVMPARSVAAV